MSLRPYTWLMLAGMGVTLVLWSRLIRRDRRLYLLYLAALASALLGAKLVYFLAEGWRHWGAEDFWLRLATGKTILGGLLGGYAGVELCKRWLGYTGITGDWFALLVSAGIGLGRIGCWTQGCCQGIQCPPSWFSLTDATGCSRWPAVPVEMLFNLLILICFLRFRRDRLLVGQHFHLYLIAYGAFRFFHEFLRNAPPLIAPLSGYQIASVAVLGLGLAGFVRRQRISCGARARAVGT